MNDCQGCFQRKFGLLTSEVRSPCRRSPGTIWRGQSCGWGGWGRREVGEGGWSELWEFRGEVQEQPISLCWDFPWDTNLFGISTKYDFKMAGCYLSPTVRKPGTLYPTNVRWSAMVGRLFTGNFYLGGTNLWFGISCHSWLLKIEVIGQISWEWKLHVLALIRVPWTIG